jgi:LacI family transcriptional regulator
MRDVAAAAGVSLKTVSRVLNDEPGVSPSLAIRVRQAAAELDYRPNLTASSLRRADQRTSTIGLLLEDIANPFFALLHRGVEDVAEEAGVGVLAASLDQDPDRERRLVSAFASRRVDGLIMVPTDHEQGYLGNEIRAGMPIVFADRLPRGLEGDGVLTDNRQATQRAVAHLIERGHRSIAFLGGVLGIQTAEERYLGFVDAMGRAGINVRSEWVIRDLHSVQEAQDAASELLAADQVPTAFLTAQNYLSIGTSRALRFAGVEHQVAMIGYDDFEFADMLNPSVSVIAQDPREIGRLAATMLFTRIAEPDRPRSVHILPSILTHRQSGDIRPMPARNHD